MYGQLDERLPIFEIADGWLVSKMGDLCIALDVEKPELFTLGENEYDTLHQAFVKGLKVLPDGTVFHMQDVYRRDRFASKVMSGEISFLSQSRDQFFDGRPFLRQRCRIYLIRRPAGRRAVSSSTSG